MTIRSELAKVLQHEDINFLLTNRIPRRLATRFLGWFEHGSTIIVFAPKGFRLCDDIGEGTVLRAGRALMHLP